MLIKYNARIIEQGNGLPDIGELVYHHDSDTLYRLEHKGCIQTDDVRGNYLYALIAMDDAVLTEKEYDSFTCSVELIEED